MSDVIRLNQYQLRCIEMIRDFYGDSLPGQSEKDIIEFALGCMCSDIVRCKKGEDNE